MSIERNQNSKDVRGFIMIVIGVLLFSAFCLFGNSQGWTGF